jgi:hypothetical protein
LYDSDAQGLLDVELLDRVMFAIYARVMDMFEVRQAQTFGQVHCRNCGSLIAQTFLMGTRNRDVPIVCEKCGWQTTCGLYLASYSGKDMLPGSRTELFEAFLARFPISTTPQEKILLLDWLIHAFHIQSGVASRLVAMNVIQGSHAQLIELLTRLAECGAAPTAKPAWLAQAEDPIRQFRRKVKSRARLLEIAAGLGISNRTKMPENELIAEILRLAPELGDNATAAGSSTP